MPYEIVEFERERLIQLRALVAKIFKAARLVLTVPVLVVVGLNLASLLIGRHSAESIGAVFVVVMAAFSAAMVALEKCRRWFEDYCRGVEQMLDGVSKTG